MLDVPAQVNGLCVTEVMEDAVPKAKVQQTRPFLFRCAPIDRSATQTPLVHLPLLSG